MFREIYAEDSYVMMDGYNPLRRIFLKIYYEYSRVLWSFVYLCEMYICALCAYVRSKDARSILAYFTQRIMACSSVLCVILAVKGCSGVYWSLFWAFFRTCFRVVFAKAVSFKVIVRLPKCDSVWSRLPTLILNVVDGVENLG